jgi:hypothetical protein
VIYGGGVRLDISVPNPFHSNSHSRSKQSRAINGKFAVPIEYQVGPESAAVSY